MWGYNMERQYDIKLFWQNLRANSWVIYDDDDDGDGDGDGDDDDDDYD